MVVKTFFFVIHFQPVVSVSVFKPESSTGLDEIFEAGPGIDDKYLSNSKDRPEA